MVVYNELKICGIQIGNTSFPKKLCIFHWIVKDLAVAEIFTHDFLEGREVGRRLKFENSLHYAQ